MCVDFHLPLSSLKEGTMRKIILKLYIASMAGESNGNSRSVGGAIIWYPTDTRFETHLLNRNWFRLGCSRCSRGKKKRENRKKYKFYKVVNLLMEFILLYTSVYETIRIHSPITHDFDYSHSISWFTELKCCKTQ